MDAQPKSKRPKKTANVTGGDSSSYQAYEFNSPARDTHSLSHGPAKLKSLSQFRPAMLSLLISKCFGLSHAVDWAVSTCMEFQGHDSS